VSWLKHHRPVYGRAELKRLIEPQTIAIVGLSRNENSFGARTRRNLAQCSSRLYGVNPTASELHGVPCFPTIDAVPERIDCAILAVPREAVEGLVEQCAAAGVGGCIIFASGYAETGMAERIAEQERLGAIAAASGMRIVGPNCIGLINNHMRAGLLFVATYASMPWRPGAIGIVSQSGGLGHATLQAVERGGSFSHFFAAGNSADVDVCDYVSYLAEDPACRVITCSAEGLKDGERLLEAGEKAFAADKPIVFYKMATANAAARAAMSHTGTLAGSNAAYDAAFRRLGIIKVDNLEDIWETASFLVKAGKPKAAGVAAIAASGGACVITLDNSERHGVAMPPPSAATMAVLEANVPEFGSAGNPCDITAQVATNPKSYEACAEALLSDPAYGAVVVMAPTIDRVNTPARAAMFSQLSEKIGKPVCVSWLSEWLQGPGADIYEADPHAALFQTTERCYRALAAWNWRAARLAAPRDAARTIESGPAARQAGRLLDAAGPRITEREAKEILAAYGVPVARDAVVQTADHAVRAAVELGYPVVLKVESPDIPHKTDAGVVRLGLKDEGSVRQAFDDITAAAERVSPKPQIRGVLVQPMIAAGTEIVVGTKLDPTFGPLIVVGMGGILVELLRDSAADLAPVGPAQARAMLESLRGYKLLTGFRGSAPADIGRLVDIIVRVSHLAADLSDRVAEIDVNPIICGPGRAIAVDALIVRLSATEE
jgi:acyl-CoA synthetase (NDP forming)